jgi:hypothetical protein
MYSLLTEFREGDNVVTTMMEHNSSYVPWYAMSREILPRLGRRVDYRLARFDPGTGELDLDHLASLVDARTKLVCRTGASNFLGTRPPLGAIRALAAASRYRQPGGERRSYLLIDGAQLVPGSFIDVQALGADYLALPGLLLGSRRPPRRLANPASRRGPGKLRRVPSGFDSDWRRPATVPRCGARSFLRAAVNGRSRSCQVSVRTRPDPRPRPG